MVNRESIFIESQIKTHESRLCVLSSVGRTSVSKTGCRGFESFRARINKREGDNISDRTQKVIKMNESADRIKQAIITYFRGVRTEWGKITWPEKNQVVVETCFVVAIVFVFTVFIYIVDIIFNALLANV